MTPAEKEVIDAAEELVKRPWSKTYLNDYTRLQNAVKALRTVRQKITVTITKVDEPHRATSSDGRDFDAAPRRTVVMDDEVYSSGRKVRDD